MIKALLLIFEPVATWDRISQARRSQSFVLFVYLVPMIILASIAEGYGLYSWGKARDLGPRKFYSLGETVLFEAGECLLYLAMVYIMAKLVKSMGATFHGRQTFAQSFGVVAYGLSPLFLFHVLDALRDISPWFPWAVGMMLCIAVLYQGVPRMLQPDPPHAFGIYLMTSLLLVLISGILRFLTAWYLQGKFTGLESFITRLSARLPLHS